MDSMLKLSLVLIITARKYGTQYKNVYQNKTNPLLRLLIRKQKLHFEFVLSFFK